MPSIKSRPAQIRAAALRYQAAYARSPSDLRSGLTFDEWLMRVLGIRLKPTRIWMAVGAYVRSVER